MKAPSFKKWFARLPALNQPQRLQTLVDRIRSLIVQAGAAQRRCPDCGCAHYRAFSRKHGIAHQAVNLCAGERVRQALAGAIHVQNVNGYHHRFRQWLARFNGVASRYLANYLGWHRALDGGRVTSAEQLLRIAIGVINR